MDAVNIVVQARMGSERLPGKMMLDLYGEPIIYRILTKLIQCQLVSNVILAIPDDPLNDILSHVGMRVRGVKVVRGSEQNLIERFQSAISKFPCKFVIRFPGDNVFPDPLQIDQLIEFHKKQNPHGFSSNLASVQKNNMIDGIGGEIFSSDLLMGLSTGSATQEQIEHLHLNFYDYKTGRATNSLVKIDAPIPTPVLARPEFALDINTIHQYPLIRDIYRNVCLDNEKYTTVDIVKYLDNRK
jgi:spore coat polysaccharide biosynthesis protein SpsF